MIINYLGPSRDQAVIGFSALEIYYSYEKMKKYILADLPADLLTDWITENIANLKRFMVS